LYTIWKIRATSAQRRYFHLVIVSRRKRITGKLDRHLDRIIPFGGGKGDSIQIRSKRSSESPTFPYFLCPIFPQAARDYRLNNRSVREAPGFEAYLARDRRAEKAARQITRQRRGYDLSRYTFGAILRGKMRLAENSWPARRNREYRNRCVSPGCSRGANRNGEGRWCWKAKRFSRHSKRALRAYIWRVGGPEIAPDFQQRLTADVGTRKVVAGRARGAARS